ncbi:gpW family head-tail joining protein [Halomonas koreensis]|uniref:GpW family head-tail joining protein n=1 Tax=Halomonas koreensis TaxID=245385 RepID=A0ABU1G308_9GAMM|nr:gpW family head-tail joining protein [Halomonas koreensis]MDR5867291.1 gpW family head-tail joining protein [Halomonas koreensis]
MAYTADDLAQVKQAILDLAAGRRATMVTRDGRTVQYARADIAKLRDLERTISAQLNAASGGRRSRTRYAATSKGL